MEVLKQPKALEALAARNQDLQEALDQEVARRLHLENQLLQFLKEQNKREELLQNALDNEVSRCSELEKEMEVLKQQKEEEESAKEFSCKLELENLQKEMVDFREQLKEQKKKEKELLDIRVDLEKEMEVLKQQELDKKIIANMFDALSKCLQVFGPFLEDDQLRGILHEIKQVITATSSRKGERAERTNTVEEKQVFYQVVQVLGGLVKTLKGSFLPYIEELSSSLMPMLNKDATDDKRRSAMRTFDDVADECPEAEYHAVFAFWFRYYDTYLPSLLEACNHDNPDIRQAAVYGVGVCAEHGGSVIKPLIGDALSRLKAVIRDPDALHPVNVMAYENAVSALAKLCHFHRDSIDLAEVIPVWLGCLPIEVDVIEAKVVHELLTLMAERSDARPNNESLPKIFSIFAEILCAKDLASEDTIRRIIKILRKFQQTLPPATFATIWSGLQPEQHLALQSIL